MKLIMILMTSFSLHLAAAEPPKEAKQTIDVLVTKNGFESNTINVKQGVPTILRVKRTTEATCATQIAVPAQKLKKDLPLNQEVLVDLGTPAKGEIRFSCGMDMIQGQVHVN